MFVQLATYLSFPALSLAANDTVCALNLPGYTHHGDCNLLCRQASWTDIIVFFLGNYVAHAATVINRPGQSTLSTILNVIMALLFPGAGIVRGLSAISRLAVFAPTELQRAARAGALCEVVYDRWDGPSSPTEELRPGKEPMQLAATELHGICRLPEGYVFRIVPRSAKFENDQEDAPLPLRGWIKHSIASLFAPRCDPRTSISCSYNVVKILVAIAQLVFAIATLYRARGDQVATFGYAAFGLTVAQYAWMSLINLLGNLLCPQYSTLFLVESEDLDVLRATIRAHGKEAEFPLNGAVGRIITPAYLWGGGLGELVAFLGSMLASIVGGIIIGAIPISVIGGLTGFSPGSSQLYERVWTMIWIVFGFTVGPIVAVLVEDLVEPRPRLTGMSLGRMDGTLSISNLSFGVNRLMFVAIPLYAAPAIGGFSTVGQMITKYGVCFGI